MSARTGSLVCVVQTPAHRLTQIDFFVALQGFASDRSLSQPERLLASVITGREMKTKWRGKL